MEGRTLAPGTETKITQAECEVTHRPGAGLTPSEVLFSLHSYLPTAFAQETALSEQFPARALQPTRMPDHTPHKDGILACDFHPWEGAEAFRGSDSPALAASGRRLSPSGVKPGVHPELEHLGVSTPGACGSPAPLAFSSVDERQSYALALLSATALQSWLAFASRQPPPSP